VKRNVYEEEYIGERICICSNSQAALWTLETLKVMSKLVWECHQASCALSSSNNIPPGHCEIQGNGDADALAREGLSSPFVELAISVLPCVGRLKVNEWLKERHSNIGEAVEALHWKAF
jgi:hypothetical protein